MLTLTSNKQAEKLIKNGVLKVNDSLEIAFDGFKINADIKCQNICSKEYRRNIVAGDIVAGDIVAGDIGAWNIIAWNIDAWNIDYHAACIAYSSFKCISIKGRRENSIHKCLDGEIELKKEETKETKGRKVKVELDSGQVVSGRIVEEEDC